MTDPDNSPTTPTPSAAPPAPPVAYAAPPAAPSDGPGFAVPATPVATPPARGGGYGKWLFVVLLPVLVVITFSGGVAAGATGLFGGAAVQATAAPNTGSEHLDLIEEAWRTIKDNYVDAKSLDDRELTYGAIRGLTEAVGDENHTSFFTAEEAAAMEQSLSGTFVGIGVQVGEDDDGGPIINSIIPNTPAEESELRRGDQIVEVDGWRTADQTIDEIVSRVRGPEGEPVTLSIARDGVEDFEVTIIRRKFDLPLVTWAMVPGSDVATIRLEQFATGATKAIQGAVGDAKAAGATALVLDLRGNPGGFVNEAIGVTSQFVGDGIVYQSIDVSGNTEKIQVLPDGVATEIPLVVLADGSSASSAEIFTGAVQDAKRGTVVGEKTFGTGTVLGRFDLSDGSSMRIGTERWITRDGRPIWRASREPDTKVELADDAVPLFPDDVRELTPAEFADATDTQLLRAVEYLENGR
jgi:carboxyl-terminal processing protease